VNIAGQRSAPDRPGRPAGRPGPGRAQRPRRWTIIPVAAVLVTLLVLTGLIFVFPAQGMPARSDAIVMLDSPGDALGSALTLARHHRAPYLVISLGTPGSGYGCPKAVPGVKLICFYPVPATTRGEAEYIGKLAGKLGWHSVTLVTITPQASRARFRVERCFSGQLSVVTTPIGAVMWPFELVYQWLAMLKAVILQRSC
jgi:hypothetical protein